MSKKVNNLNSPNFDDELQQSLISTILKTQLKNDCSEMTFEELNTFFYNCLDLGGFLVIPLNKEQLIKAVLEFKKGIYDGFFTSTNSLPIDKETYDLLLNLLKDKQKEDFVDDWKTFIDDYLHEYLRENENLNTEAKIRKRISQLKNNHSEWFIDLIKEARRKQEEWEKETSVKRRKAISSYQERRVNFFGQTTEKVKDEILPFEIFPKGELTTEQFIRKLKHNGFSVSFEDERRLRKIEKEFNFKNRCVGKGDFKEYVVYRFENTNVVIAEKPAYGNATYLIKGDWKKDVLKILQMSRAEARNFYPNKVKRVIHNNEKQWLFNLKFEFSMWF